MADTVFVFCSVDVRAFRRNQAAQCQNFIDCMSLMGEFFTQLSVLAFKRQQFILQGFDFTAAVQARCNTVLNQAQLRIAIGNFLLNFLDHLRFASLPHSHPCASCVQNADRFVWQLPASDVAVREANSIFDGLIQNFHRMVFFQSGNDPAKHVHRGIRGWLFHLDHLESACQSRVALNIFFVLSPGRGGNGSQLAPGQSGFQ